MGYTTNRGHLPYKIVDPQTRCFKGFETLSSKYTRKSHDLTGL